MARYVGIVVHRNRADALNIAAQVVDWLRERGLSTRLDPMTADRMGRPELAHAGDQMEDVEFILTLGGDGTILTAARLAAPRAIPILGIHMGRFGFIAETHPRDLYKRLGEVLAGRMPVEERMMIEAEVWRRNASVQRSRGLNEVVVKSGVSHLLQMRTYIGGAEFATYPADGLIVATPTGSTAYALSAGGPIIAPTVEALLLVPICPHTLNARPMVIPSTESVAIEIQSDGEVLFAIDGVDPLALQDGDRVTVRRADCVTRLIVLDHGTFYRKVRNRYLYGERPNQ